MTRNRNKLTKVEIFRHLEATFVQEVRGHERLSTNVDENVCDKLYNRIV